jgi:hypothetical protein
VTQEPSAELAAWLRELRRRVDALRRSRKDSPDEAEEWRAALEEYDHALLLAATALGVPAPVVPAHRSWLEAALEERGHSGLVFRYEHSHAYDRTPTDVEVIRGSYATRATAPSGGWGTGAT